MIFCPLNFFLFFQINKIGVQQLTACLNAKAISKGFFAFAIAVLTKTPSHPNSIAIVASDA